MTTSGQIVDMTAVNEASDCNAQSGGLTAAGYWFRFFTPPV
jgi:hypothetical protein